MLNLDYVKLNLFQISIQQVIKSASGLKKYAFKVSMVLLINFIFALANKIAPTEFDPNNMWLKYQTNEGSESVVQL